MWSERNGKGKAKHYRRQLTIDEGLTVQTTADRLVMGQNKRRKHETTYIKMFKNNKKGLAEPYFTLYSTKCNVINISMNTNNQNIARHHMTRQTTYLKTIEKSYIQVITYLDPMQM